MKTLHNKPKPPIKTTAAVIMLQLMCIVGGMIVTIWRQNFTVGWFLTVAAPILLPIAVLTPAWVLYDYRLNRYFSTVCILLLCLALTAPCFAQQPVPQYAYVWQPVAVPGQWIAVQRHVGPIQLPILTSIIGPNWYFIPQQQVVQPQYQPPQVPPLQVQSGGQR